MLRLPTAEERKEFNITSTDDEIVQTGEWLEWVHYEKLPEIFFEVWFPGAFSTEQMRNLTKVS